MARILVIDDNEAYRLMLQHMLERAGHHVDAAADGAQAVDLNRKSPPDLVITDIFIPDQDGLDIIAELRRDSPDLKFIAVSGGAPTWVKDYFQAARKAGARHVLSKPFRRQELLDAVGESLTEKPA